MFSRLLATATGAPRQSVGARLLERLANSTQIDDRREAISDFKELAATEPVRLVDKGGMAVLVGLLAEEVTQITRDTLECLSNLVDPDVPRDTGEGTDRDKVVTKATHNAGIFLSRDTYLTAVLHSSQDQDLYVRFHAIQLAMKLLSRSRGPTQDAVLNQPTTVGHVLDLANDSREIVRNEVLLLLAALSEGSAALQNILAFQGAFEQLLGIIETERDGAANADGAGGGRGSSGSLTGADGGGGGSGGFGLVIIHDCLQIMCRLLESNSSACRFFRESGTRARPGAAQASAQSHQGARHVSAADLRAAQQADCSRRGGGVVSGRGRGRG